MKLDPLSLPEYGHFHMGFTWHRFEIDHASPTYQDAIHVILELIALMFLLCDDCMAKSLGSPCHVIHCLVEQSLTLVGLIHKYIVLNNMYLTHTHTHTRVY